MEDERTITCMLKASAEPHRQEAKTMMSEIAKALCIWLTIVLKTAAPYYSCLFGKDVRNTNTGAREAGD